MGLAGRESGSCDRRSLGIKMKIIEGRVRVAASDVGNFLACRRLTQLDLLRARGGAAAAAGVRRRVPGSGPARGGARAGRA